MRGSHLTNTGNQHLRFGFGRQTGLSLGNESKKETGGGGLFNGGAVWNRSDGREGQVTGKGRGSISRRQPHTGGGRAQKVTEKTGRGN